MGSITNLSKFLLILFVFFLIQQLINSTDVASVISLQPIAAILGAVGLMAVVRMRPGLRTWLRMMPAEKCTVFNPGRGAMAGLIFFAVSSVSMLNAQVTLVLDYQVKAPAPTSVQSGDWWTMQLDYSISSTMSPNISDVKIEIPLPDYIEIAQGVAGTSHAPLSNFVFSGTPGAKKLTINFINPVPTGVNGVLEFRMHTYNGTTPDGTVIATCATLTDGSGATSGAQCSNMPITAQYVPCGFKTLTSGGAIGGQTVYRSRIGYNPIYVLEPFGALDAAPATTVTLTDNYPAGATYINARVVNSYGGAVPATITQSGNTVTAVMTASDFNADWLADVRIFEVTLRYDAPTFSSGQSVTNTFSYTITPVGQSTPITIGTGAYNCGGQNSDFEETHTLQLPQFTATLTKGPTSGYSNQINSGASLEYDFNFTNTGNMPLDNVEIIETIPADLTFTGMYLDAYGTQVTAVQYQTNLNPTWTTWSGILAGSTIPAPTVASGEKITLLKFILANPFASLSSLPGYSRLRFSAGTVTNPTPVTNCMEWNSTTSGIPSNRQACSAYYTIMPAATTASIRYESSYTPGCASPFALNTELTLNGIIRANTGFAAIQNPVVGYLVRNGAEYVSGSEMFMPNTSGISGTPSFTVTSNYITLGGISYDLLRWTFPSGTTVPTGTNFSVSVRVKLTNTLPPNQAVQFLLIADGSNVSEYTFTGDVALNFMFTDTNDWDGDGNTTEAVNTSNASWNSCTTSISASADMESVKWVKGQCDAAYSRFPASGQTIPGGNVDYKLNITNTGNIPMTELVVVDILPFVGDLGVVTFTPRNSEWRPNLSGTITGTGATVYYSTASNPCRPELGITAPGCTAPNWSTTPPGDITTVQSVKLEFGATVIQPNQSFEFNWPMRAPVTAPTGGEIAWNSFGFTATRTDNMMPLLAAEPPQVGISVKAGAPAYYGNLVWLDNNQNGIQDSGEPGIDGVTVTLYNALNQVVNFTVTANGGLYRFSNLQPGDYYAVFTPPAGYFTSPYNAPGSTSSNNSDGSLSGGVLRTVITTLDALEDDPSWDQGFYLNAGCVVPSGITTSQVPPTCTGATANNNGTISLTAVSNGTHYGFSSLNAGVYDGPAFASATAITALPAVIMSSVPNAGGGYILRIYNGDNSCYTDVIVVVNTVTCTAGCTQPSAITTSQVPPTCTGMSANNNGTASLVTVTSGTHFGVSTLNAASYDGPAFASATALPGTLPTVVKTAIPNSGGSYIVRIFNGDAACFTDQTITVTTVNCSCAPIPCGTTTVLKN